MEATEAGIGIQGGGLQREGESASHSVSARRIRNLLRKFFRTLSLLRSDLALSGFRSLFVLSLETGFCFFGGSCGEI